MLDTAGPRVWTTALTQIRVGRSFIEENQPPRLSSVMAFPFFVLLVAVVAVLVARRHHLSATDVLLVAGTGVAALTAVRAVPLFATVATPVLAIHLSELLASRSARRPARNRTARDLSPRHAAVLHLVVVVLLAGVVVTQVRAEQRPEAVAAQEARELPVAAARWIEANHPGGALLNPFDWGGYLIWALPSYPVSIDGRADLYADDLAHYQALLDGRTWRDQFARQQIGVVLLPPDAGLVRALQVDGGWRIAFRDRTAVVLVPDGR